MTLNGIAHFSQPDFYRFSDDSVVLAKFIADEVSLSTGNRILDLCCGCGVVGLEVLARTSTPLHLDSLEIQSEFREYFDANCKKLNSSHGHDIHFIVSDYNDYSSPVPYNLILCNPPYFNSESNRPSPDEKRNRCRIFNSTERENLLKCIERLLGTESSCYILVRKAEGLYKLIEESIVFSHSCVREMGEVLLLKLTLNID